jgi:hypothetical protein
VKYWLELVIALPFALLPRRYWQSIDLPVPNVASASALLTMVVGLFVWMRGCWSYLVGLRQSSAASILDIATLQVAGKLPETAAVSAVPGVIYMTAPVAFAFFTPLGLLATYIVISGLARSVTGLIGEPSGDPILTGADALGRTLFHTKQQRALRVERAKLEKMDEPDRRYDGEWAGLPDADFVIVAARRKPGWTRGTWIITEDGWFVLGEPFDRPMPNGLRTIYPLTAQTTLEPVRKSVQYQLPPLRRAPPRRREG